jgi:hypothetical protein
MSKNGESGSVKVPEKARLIIARYERFHKAQINPHNLIFPYLMDLPSLDDRYQFVKKFHSPVSD